jgi:SAM-dependent methyltransferase
MKAIYDAIGESYSRVRDSDPRIEHAIEGALAGCSTVLNVGAGTGSYEPRNLRVVALEPSMIMIKQRTNSTPVVQGRAEALPFADRSFDAVLGVLTLHHWSDQSRGIAECARVANDRVVFLTMDPELHHSYWLFDYLPGLLASDRSSFRRLNSLRDAFQSLSCVPVPIPADCRDGFLGAYWKRPAAYAHPNVRAGISSFSKIPAAEAEQGLARLKSDLESGAWAKRYAAIQDLQALDIGYRLIIGTPFR